MAKTRALVKRRKAVRNIRKITRTMELIATARFKKAMDRSVQATQFTRRIGELVRDLSQSSGGDEVGHPLLQERPVRNEVLLTLTSNRGLAGGYNANVLRVMQRVLNEDRGRLPGEVRLEVSGKRGQAFARFRGLPTEKSYAQFEDKPTFEQVEELADAYVAAFLAGTIDAVKVVYTRFISSARQEAVVETLLPLGSLDAGPTATDTAGAPATATRQYEYIPSKADILDELVPLSFKVRLYKCFLDAAVSEQIGRMIAMKGATENAGDIIKTLSMQYNRARQSQITSELAEIIGTSEALK